MSVTTPAWLDVFHRGLVRLNGNERLIHRDGVARLDHQLYDGDLDKVPNVRSDPDLLTRKALKAIQRATVLFVDNLVSDEIVAFANTGARRR